MQTERAANMGTTLRGALKFPAHGELVARFGVPRDGSGPAWKGWFIRAAGGTPVAAVAAGRIVYSDWLRGFGNLVIVDHGEGFMSLYGNNDALLQQVGDQVVAGQPIAQAGSSGGALESGVYFEWRHNGVALDPKEWFGREAIASSSNRSH
jgi:septal ring factor EnvC (AmiA/AmiB activator)